MKVFALTLLGLAALAQARVEYTLQCTRDEIGIRWPSYYSNSEYYVCQGILGNQLTVQCNPGEVFTFVLQQCSAPALYIPAPPLEMLPTAAPITVLHSEAQPPIIGVVPHLENHLNHHGAEPQNHHTHHPEVLEEVHVALPVEHVDLPTPPTPAPLPPLLAVPNKPMPKPVAPKPSSGSSKPTAPKASGAKKPAVASPKKPAAPSKAAPSKAAKKPAPPSKAAKKPEA